MQVRLDQPILTYMKSSSIPTKYLVECLYVNLTSFFLYVTWSQVQNY